MKPYIIAVAGPSGAGKSLFCRILQSRYSNVSRLKLDDFFKDKDDVPVIDGCINWDHPDSLKWDIMVQALKDLKDGKHAMVPHYSRKDDKCVGEKCVLPAEVMLFDGFMTLVNPELRDLIDLKLYFDLSEDSQIKRRRMRQPWVEDDYLYKIMIPAARMFIAPGKQYADYIINAELLPVGVSEQCINLIHSHFRQVKTSSLEKSKVSHLYSPSSYQFQSVNLKSTKSV
ncbi:hypothetical protein KJ673_00910 [Patescibacteria group bacterium]|nr:hypothetical protein [Patescibacteria group bacterium]MBU4453119.1 hypothetical protein [Patescibacteria group bacterium]MCG2687451.1 hypothetical protein [Candidatus Parcubacteria bacterium]